MGYKQLSEKISDVVQSDIPYTEKDVLYTIVESWKLCERLGQTTNFPFLKFFRNWCVHTVIDRNLYTGISDILTNTNTTPEQKLEILMDGLNSELSIVFKQIRLDPGTFFDFSQFSNELKRILSEQPVDFEVKKLSLVINEETLKPAVWENI